MSQWSREELNALCRADFCAFVQRVFDTLHPGTEYKDNWHIRYITSALQRCIEGPSKRLAINLPPRNMKSIIASVALPLFILGRNPAARIICVSYGQDLADTFARNRLTIARSDWYQEVFPDMQLAERQAVSEFATKQQGFCLATSVGGALTGRGADYIILDDPLKPEEALSESSRERVNSFFSNTLYSRLDDKANGRIVLVMQRLHQNDLVGHVLEMEPWDRIVLPAIAQEAETIAFDTFAGREVVSRQEGEALHPARESLETLQRLRNVMGSYNFDAQYLQAPSPLGGGIVKQSWFRWYSPPELPQRFEQVIQSWDTAAKPTELSNYSVCTTWGLFQRRIYLLDVYRQRLAYPDLKRAVAAWRSRFSAAVVLIEDKSSGTALLQDLRAEGVAGIHAYQPVGDKIMRMNAQSATIESGLVYLPNQASWLDDYLLELTTFPAGRFSDQTDSTSQALDWIKQNGQVTPEQWFAIWNRSRGIQSAPGSMIRLKALAGVKNFCVLNSGIRSVDDDGTALVTQEMASLLLKSGWTVA